MDEKKRKAVTARVSKTGASIRKLGSARLTNATDEEFGKIKTFLHAELQKCLETLDASRAAKQPKKDAVNFTF